MPISWTAWAAATAIGQRLRVGHADVLGRGDDDAAGDEPRVLAGLDHPGQVVQRGVDVAAPHRLDERADDVVVLVALSVVAQQRPVDRRRDGVGVDDRARSSSSVRPAPAVGATARRGLERGQRASGVAGREPDDRRAGFVAEDDGAAEPAGVLHRAVDEHAEVGVGQRLERQQQRPGQQRRDHRERRVLGGRGDEDHPAVLDAGQQGVLLGLAEPVDLVEEQHRGRRRTGRGASAPSP